MKENPPNDARPARHRCHGPYEKKLLTDVSSGERPQTSSTWSSWNIHLFFCILVDRWPCYQVRSDSPICPRYASWRLLCLDLSDNRSTVVFDVIRSVQNNNKFVCITVHVIAVNYVVKLSTLVVNEKSFSASNAWKVFKNQIILVPGTAVVSRRRRR